MNRTQFLSEIRETIITDESKTSLSVESFQSNTLRPILKVQNHIIIALTSQHLKAYLLHIDTKDQLAFIQNYIQKNSALKQQIVGVCIGLFSEDEMEFYLQNQTEINKRITQLVVKRISDYWAKDK